MSINPMSSKFDEEFYRYLNPDNKGSNVALNMESFYCKVCDKYLKFNSLEKLKEGFDKHQDSKKHKIKMLLSYSSQPDFHITVTKLQPNLSESNQDFKTRFERKFKWMAYDRNRPYCTICRKYLGRKSTALATHEKTKKHIRNELYEKDIKMEQKRAAAIAEIEDGYDTDYPYEDDGEEEEMNEDNTEDVPHEQGVVKVAVGVSDVEINNELVINSEIPEDDKSQIKVNRYYNRLWQNQFPWVIEHPISSNKPYCRICRVQLSCKKSSLVAHEQSRRHARLSRFHAKYFSSESGETSNEFLLSQHQDDECDPGRIQRHYQDYWEKRFRWLLPRSPYNSNKTFCALCKIELGVQKNTLVKHENTKQHKENEILALKNKKRNLMSISKREVEDNHESSIDLKDEEHFEESEELGAQLQYEDLDRPSIDEDYEITHGPSNTTVRVSSTQFSNILDRLNKQPSVKLGPSKSLEKKLLEIPECPFDVLWRQFMTTCLRINVGDTIPTCVDCPEGELLSKYIAKHILMHIQEEEMYIKTNGHCKNCKLTSKNLPTSLVQSPLKQNQSEAVNTTPCLTKRRSRRKRTRKTYNL